MDYEISVFCAKSAIQRIWGGQEIDRFLSQLARSVNVAAPVQKQALKVLHLWWPPNIQALI
ncbi:MAG: hypothetical protein COA36_09170 [Desulfotalea sp.]|nr:MAG: hypothetical protein COA36_09170 [Desulfotalea sp.]